MLAWLHRRDVARADELFDAALASAQDRSPLAALVQSQYAMYVNEVDDRPDDAGELVHKSLSQLTRALAQTTSDVDARLRGIVHWNAAQFFAISFNDWDAALEHFDAASKLLSDDADLSCQAAVVRLRRAAGRDDHQTALRLLNDIADRFPTHAATQAWLGFLHDQVRLRSLIFFVVVVFLIDTCICLKHGKRQGSSRRQDGQRALDARL